MNGGSTNLYLITRADDCGSNATANRAILEACDHGIVKNVSLMACCEAIEEAARLFANRDDICFGLHGTLNSEWDHVKWGPVAPLDSVTTLTDSNGHFWRHPSMMKQQGADVSEVIAELQAQLDKLRSLGFHVRYADQHMFFGHALPDFDKLFDEWCTKEGLINFSRCYRGIPNVPLEAPDRVEALLDKLQQLETGIYTLIAHPAYDTPEMRMLSHEGLPGSLVAESRDWERKFFVDPRIIAFIKERGIIPIRYDEVTHF